MLEFLTVMQSAVPELFNIGMPILLVIGLIVIVYLLFDIRKYVKKLAETE